ncbi:MAG: hypothetical protein K5696_01710 [Lachnospiraceae bacterium]|nr:hypothetical protein [Lachnospiraceae bacterium]
MKRKICLFGAGEGSDVSLYFIPGIISVTITLFLLRGLALTTPRYEMRSAALAVLCSVAWIAAFVINQRRLSCGQPDGASIRCGWVIPLLLGIIIALYLVSVVWGSGYLSLAPFERIDNGTQHRDNLLHSAIAESCRRSMFPSTLVNDERYHSYHTFSHMLIGRIAGLMGMPSFIVYNYLYPVIFLPLFVFSVLTAVSSAKRYFEDHANLCAADIAIISLCMTGAFRDMSRYGVWKASCIISESFLISVTMASFFYALTFWLLKRYPGGGKISRLYCVFGIPAIIFLVSWAKVSVGFLFAAAIMYYLVRLHAGDLRCWLLCVYYSGVFLVACRLFNYTKGDIGGAVSSRFQWLAFARYCGGTSGYMKHMAILSLTAVVFIVLECRRSRFTGKDVINGRTVWVEMILLITVLGFLPGLVMDIKGGSAAYFSMAVEEPALLLLCGHDYMPGEKAVRRWAVPIVSACLVLWAVWMGYDHRAESPFSYITGEHDTHLSETLLEIRSEVGRHPSRYTIYLDEDSVVEAAFPAGQSGIFVCQAMTGVGVINATYHHDGKNYTFTGEVYTGGQVCENDRLSLDEAIRLAAERGKKHIVRILASGYETIDCGG